LERSAQALLARDNVRRQCADRDRVKRRSSSSGNLRMDLVRKRPQRSRLLGPLAIRLKSSLSQARRARGGPLCRSTAAPARSAADRTEMSQVGQTRFAQSPSARDSERSSARQGLPEGTDKTADRCRATQASPRSLVATCSRGPNADHPSGKSLSAILSMATSSGMSAAPRRYLSGSVPDKCTRTSSTASERFSLMNARISQGYRIQFVSGLRLLPGSPLLWRWPPAVCGR